MLSQLLNQMDEHLSQKPFVRTHWWSKRWIVYIAIQPPLTKIHPLWKRTKDELRLLRLFNLSPEELGKKIELYWKKPRWRRWFASFGMNKKIDVWNYYQRCLAYQEILQGKPKLERSLAITNESQFLLKNLALVLHKSNVKFEGYLEKNCRNPKWIEKYFLEAVRCYKQQLQSTFSIKLNKYLKHINTEGERLALIQQAEKEYQQVEELMFHYYQRWHIYAFSSLRSPEIGIDVINDSEANKNQERRIAVYTGSSTSTSSLRTFHRRDVLQNVIGSLDKAKEWIQTQRERLKLFIEEGSPKKVKELLQSSLNEIKNITEPQLKCCEIIILNIEENHEPYDTFLEHLDKLQDQLKPLLQGGLLLFHSDHVLNLTHSQEIWDIITQYGQIYLEQSRYYFDTLKNYHQRIRKFYNQHLQKQQALEERAEIAIRIQKLEQSIIELDKQLKEDSEKFRAKMEVRFEQDKIEMLAGMEAKRIQNNLGVEIRFERDKAEILADIEAKFEPKINKLFAKLKQQKISEISDKSIRRKSL